MILDASYTLLVACIALLIGMFVVKFTPFLQKNHIPEAVVIYRTLCFNSFHSCLSLNQPKDRAKIKENFLTESILSWNIVK